MSSALNSGRRLLPMQDALLRSPATIIGVFGGWRSGKTRGCALKFFANCVANPWRPDYGEDHPFSLVIGWTHKVLVDSAYREIKAVIPRAAILGAVEGASACGVWLDEAHLLPDESAYLNYQMRASDALGRRFLVLVSGLPESGWLQDTFDRSEHHADPSRATLFCRTADNHYNPPHVVAQFRSSVSRQTAIKYLEGRWMPREGVIYYEYDPRVHITDDQGDRAQHVHIGVDIGSKGAVVFFQERPRMIAGNLTMCLHVVDELLPEQASTEVAMRQVMARGWRLDPQRSLICVDPTTRRDEFDSIRRVMGDQIRIIRKDRGDSAEQVEYGIDCVNAALRDANGHVRLTMASSLPTLQRSLRTAIPRYHRRNGRPVRDDIIDHVLDAWRYPVVHLLPIKRRGHEVSDR